VILHTLLVTILIYYTELSINADTNIMLRGFITPHESLKLFFL